MAEMTVAQVPEVATEVGRGALRLLLRPEEGADAIGVSRARFYELLSEGRIKSIKIGRSRRVPVSEIKNWIDAELAQQTA